MSKTIVEKLNLHKFNKIAVIDKPENENSLEGLPEHEAAITEGQYDLIFAYVLEMQSLQELVKKVINDDRLAPGGYLYAAYPKKGNKAYSTYIHRDSLFEGLGADEDGYIG